MACSSLQFYVCVNFFTIEFLKNSLGSRSSNTRPSESLCEQWALGSPLRPMRVSIAEMRQGLDSPQDDRADQVLGWHFSDFRKVTWRSYWDAGGQECGQVESGQLIQGPHFEELSPGGPSCYFQKNKLLAVVGVGLPPDWLMVLMSAVLSLKSDPASPTLSRTGSDLST